MDLKSKPYLNLDSSAQVGIASLIDGAKDDAMNNTRRPGLGGSEDLGLDVVTGTDSDMSGANNWVAIDLTTFNVNSTVSGKMYMLAGSGQSNYARLDTVGLIEEGEEYEISVDLSLYSGDTVEVSVKAGGAVFNVTPTASETTFTGRVTSGVSPGTEYFEVDLPFDSTSAITVDNFTAKKVIPVYEIDLGENAPVDSLYEWDRQNLMVAVCNGKIFKIDRGGVGYNTTEITGATAEKGTPATFADFGDTLFIANGGKIIKWQAVNNTCAYLTDIDAPTTVSHIGFVDQYLIALNDTDGLINFSEVADPDTWEGEYFDAERLPDKTIAMHTGFGEIIPFASMSIEYMGNTGNATLPWQRYEGKVTQRGTIAPYSIQMIDNSYFFIDEDRKIIRLTGSNPQIISNPFDSEFQKLEVITDAIGMHIKTGGDTFYVVTFPTEQKTYAYDYKRDVFSEWTYQNNSAGKRENYLGNTSCYVKRWNVHYVGSRLSSGYIYTCSKDIYRDGSESSTFELTTGWQGDGSWRKVRELVLKLKRGKGAALATPEPFLEVFYRDSNANPNQSTHQWQGPRIVNLGQLGESDQIYRVQRMGRYRNRQYKFVCSGNVPIVLMEATEVYG